MTQLPTPVSIRLSGCQVDEVLKATAAQPAPPALTTLTAALIARSGGAGAGDLIAGAASGASARSPSGGRHGDKRLSRSLLRGLALLERLAADRTPRGIVELAEELAMSPSTAHRYAFTLVELGLLARCPDTRKYHLPAG